MDEGAAKQEKQPMDPKMLSISKDSFSTAFKELNPQESPSLWQKEGENEINELRENNPHVLNSIEELTKPYPEEKAKQMLRGALTFYRALRKDIEAKGKVLPKLTEEFVKEYDYQTLIRGAEIGEEAVLDEGLTSSEASDKARRRIVANFRNLEPELSEVVEKELGNQPNWRPEENDIYLGIIDMYSLMRVGLSDPKNFQESMGS